jgi:hypothetical protein
LLASSDLVNSVGKLSSADLMACLLCLRQSLIRLYLMLLALSYHDLLQHFVKLSLGWAYGLDLSLGNKTPPRYFQLQFPKLLT